MKIKNDIIPKFKEVVADLNQVNDLLKANVHAAADQAREHTASIRTLIDKLKSQDGSITADDLAQLQAIHDGIQAQISTLKESANAVTTIVPPDVPDAGSPSETSTTGTASAGDAAAPALGQAPPPDGSGNPQT